MSAGATTTIRVSTRTRDALKVLASRSGATADEVISRLVNKADEEVMLADMARDFDRLACDEKACSTYRDESAVLDSFGVEPPPW